MDRPQPIELSSLAINGRIRDSVFKILSRLPNDSQEIVVDYCLQGRAQIIDETLAVALLDAGYSAGGADKVRDLLKRHGRGRQNENRQRITV